MAKKQKKEAGGDGKIEVTLLKEVRFEGKRGGKVRVSPERAERWARDGICKLPKGFRAPEPEPEEESQGDGEPGGDDESQGSEGQPVTPSI